MAYMIQELFKTQHYYMSNQMKPKYNIGFYILIPYR